MPATGEGAPRRWGARRGRFYNPPWARARREDPIGTAPAIPLVALASAALVGFACWGLVEYTVHGVLAHRHRTFVTPLHGGHHREPRAVFTAPAAWVPVALAIFAAGAALGGLALAGAFVAGLLLGFARYECVHWRIHFRAPRTARERLLRSHHLAHHFRDARAYHGVTTRLWDRVFGTLPSHWREDYARVADVPPLLGPSNLRAIWSPRHVARLVREARRGGERPYWSAAASTSSRRTRTRP